MNGRKPCPDCNSRDTEKTTSGYRQDTFECHGCGNEWSEYNGVPCPRCESKNTRRKRRGVAPHSKTMNECQICGKRFPIGAQA